MISCSKFQEWIEPWLDGELAEGEGLEAESHLAGCEACRRELEDARALRRAVAHLPRRIEPPRDLLPAILTSVGATSPNATRLGKGFWSPRLPWVAAAAMILVLIAVGIWGLRATQRPVALQDEAEAARLKSPGLSAALEDYIAAEQEYLRAADALLRSLEREAGGIPPGAQAALLQDLAVVDRAISQVRASLGSGSRDPEREHLLVSLYHQKTKLLQRASRLSMRLG